jgi:diaminopimelate decarboxylase
LQQANFLAENAGNTEKIAPWLPQIYSLIYAADYLGLSSLMEFKTVMNALNNPQALAMYVNAEIIQLLQPAPTYEELNIYFVEFTERNKISLEEINMGGHHFKSNPFVKEDSFADI